MLTLEEAIAKIEELEKSNAALLAKRDELLSEVKAVKAKYRDPLGDVDPTEAMQAYQRLKSGELVVKATVESEIEGKYQNQSQSQIKELQQSIQALKDSLEAERQAKKQATIKGEFTSVLSPQVNHPKQLLTILEAEGRIKESEDGNIVGVYKGEELTPAEFVNRLKEDPEYQFHFKPTGASGSGKNFQDGGGNKASNPWDLKTWNVTKQFQMMKEAPEKAAALKREAGAK